VPSHILHLARAGWLGTPTYTSPAHNFVWASWYATLAPTLSQRPRLGLLLLGGLLVAVAMPMMVVVARPCGARVLDAVWGFGSARRMVFVVKQAIGHILLSLVLLRRQNQSVNAFVSRPECANLRTRFNFHKVGHHGILSKKQGCPLRRAMHKTSMLPPLTIFRSL
jgi:hypothetical protein